METSNNQNQDQVQGIEIGRLLDFFALCIRKWWWFAISVFVICGFAYLHILRTEPSYGCTAAVMIKSDSRSRTVTSRIEAIDMNALKTTSSVDNEIIAIQSVSLMREVVRRIKLNNIYTTRGRWHSVTLYGKTLPVSVDYLDVDDSEGCEFKLKLLSGGKFEMSDFKATDELPEISVKGSLFDTLKTPIGRVVVTPALAYTDDLKMDINCAHAPVNAVAKKYSSKMTATLNDKKADVFTLNVTDVHPQRAEDLLAMVIAIYNEKWVLDKNQIAKSTSAFIQDRLTLIEQDLGGVDSDISSFKSANLLPDITAATNMYLSQNSETNKKLLDLDNQVNAVSSVMDYMRDESNKNQLLPSGSNLYGQGLDAQIKEYNTIVLRRNSLASSSSPSNPLVISLDQSIESMRESIVASVETQLLALNAQRNALVNAEKKTTSKIAMNPSQAKYLISVERKQGVLESLYLYLLQQREQNELNQAFTAYNTRVIDPPIVTEKPIAPSKKNIMVIAFMLGLFIPLVLLYVQEVLNTKVRGRKDVENMSVPFLAEIPQVKKTNAERAMVKHGSRDIINEAFRVLRTNLQFMMKDGEGARVVAFTSSNPASGKSFIALNLAMSYAIKGKKVLLIDGDMRHCSTSEYLSNPKNGLSIYLSDDSTSLHDVITVDETTGLSIIPVGVTPPNPTELLETPRFEHLINAAKEEFDIIFIDCPPVDVVADASIIAGFATNTIFVIRAGLMSRSMLPLVESYYKDHRFNSMALVLNGTEMSGSSHRYGYGYGYAYGYGYGYGYGHSYGSYYATDEKGKRKHHHHHKKS